MSSFPLVSAYSHVGLYIYNAHKKHPFLEILIILSASRSPDQQPLCLSSLQSISPALGPSQLKCQAGLIEEMLQSISQRLFLSLHC